MNFQRGSVDYVRIIKRTGQNDLRLVINRRTDEPAPTDEDFAKLLAHGLVVQAEARGEIETKPVEHSEWGSTSLAFAKRRQFVKDSLDSALASMARWRQRLHQQPVPRSGAG